MLDHVLDFRNLMLQLRMKGCDTSSRRVLATRLLLHACKVSLIARMLQVETIISQFGDLFFGTSHAT